MPDCRPGNPKGEGVVENPHIGMTDERIRGRSVLQLNRSAPTDVLKRPKIYPQDNIRLALLPKRFLFLHVVGYS